MSVPVSEPTASSAIRVETRHLPAADLALPSLALRVTALVGSYMLWIGTTDVPPEDVERAPMRGTLARDWACAMPSTIPNIPAPATSLYRSPTSDVALPMAQRLARRFSKQIFLSVDVPPEYLSGTQGPKLLLEVEKGLVQTLKELEQQQK